MRVLIVAMPHSVHTARWLNQLSERNDIEIVLFPSVNVKDIHPDLLDLPRLKVLIPYLRIRKLFDLPYLKLLILLLDYFTVRFQKKFVSHPKEKSLFKAIRKFKPDIIHSLETQSAGYLVNSTRSLFEQRLKRNWPVWWHTNWGSDFFLYGRIKEHKEKIRQLLEQCDIYSCECTRDISLAEKYGFKGKSLPVYPNSGGFDLTLIEKLRNRAVPTSDRKIISLKGYQGWAGRALFGLRALFRTKSLLQGYSVAIFSNTEAEDIRIAAELFEVDTGIKVNLLPEGSSHTDVLTLLSKSKIYLGLSISDGISTSMLEAMAMGAFPIQSDTSGAADWIEDGVSGLLVPPEDPDVIEEALKRALQMGAELDRIERINYQTIKNRANYKLLQKATCESYDMAYRMYNNGKEFSK